MLKIGREAAEIEASEYDHEMLRSPLSRKPLGGTPCHDT
jgi:hypothetical protein